MTREEAIAILEVSKHMATSGRMYNQAIDMAIEALSTPSGDLISRTDSIRWVKTECNPYGKPTLEFKSGKRVIEHLKQMPSADAVQGEWVEKEVMVDEDTNITEWQSARCSVCGKYHTTPYMYYFDNFNFCPNCGARMKGGEEE